jgi:uncharacterized membrane protein YfcA
MLDVSRLGAPASRRLPLRRSLRRPPGPRACGPQQLETAKHLEILDTFGMASVAAAHRAALRTFGVRRLAAPKHREGGSMFPNVSRGFEKPPQYRHHPPVNLDHWHWALLALAAFLCGMSKTGFAGLGVLGVAFFAIALPARYSTGALLPVLVCADFFGVAIFRKHAEWTHLWKLFPWVVVGIVLGCFALGKFSNAQAQRTIGIILLVMVLLQLWRQRQTGDLTARLPHAWWFVALTGIAAGFATMTANAAGPLMVLYLLAIGLPKLALVGTGAWFFLFVNLFKVPFSVHLGLITADSLRMDAILCLPMIPGALLGPVILKRLNQTAFEIMVIAFTVIAAIRLLV